MPIVPSFQNGVPTVDDAGNTGFTAHAAPQPSNAYAKTFQMAMTTAHEAAGDMVKLELADAARRTKAESDDAEVQAMDIINRYTLDPKTGYFNQLGKNAIDSFEPTREGMTEELKTLQDSLSPQAREAVQSRILDRVSRVDGQMLRWKSAQSQQYYLGASQSRVSALVSDAANNYANEVDLAKTRASIEQELAYQAKMQGWAPEVLQEQRRKSQDDLAVTRFQAWGADDPIGALTALQANKGTMSADTYQALNTKVFAQAKDQLAATVAQRLPRNMTKQQLADLVRNPNTKTGIAVVDSLSPANRAQVLSSAFGFVERDRAASQAAVKESLDNDIAEARANGFASDEKAPSYFVSKYGQEQGAQMYEKYKYSLDVNSAMHDMFTAPNQSIDMWVAASKPEAGDPNFATKIKNYNALYEAGQKIKEARAKDPAAYAVAAGIWQPLNLQNTEQLASQLKDRQAKLSAMKANWGRAEILSQDEAGLVLNGYQNLATSEAVGYITTVAQGLGKDGFNSLQRLANGSKDLAGKELLFGLALDDSKKTLLNDAVAGAAALRDGRVKVGEAALTGDKSKDKAILDKALNLRKEISDVFSQPLQQQALLGLTRMLTANNLLNGKDEEEAKQSGLQAALGGSKVNYQNHAIVLSGDLDTTDVDDSLAELGRQIKKGQIFVGPLGYVNGDGRPALLDPDTAAKLMQEGPQLQTTGTPNVFKIVYGGTYLYKRDGTPLLLTVTQRPSKKQFASDPLQTEEENFQSGMAASLGVSPESISGSD